MKKLRRLGLVAALSSAPFGAGADVLVGGITGTDSSVAHPVVRYADGANGSTKPLSTFSTDDGSDVMHTPYALTYEPVEDVLYVYAADASGNLAALRVLNPPALGQPRKIAVSTEHDELYTTFSGCCIATYDRTASGNAAGASRYIQWGGSSGSVTRLNYPYAVAWRAASEELIVVDNGSGGGAGVILFFDRLAADNAAPGRTIEGDQTLLDVHANTLAYDASHDEIFVIAQVDSSTNRIVVFDASASGNTPPKRSIEGASTLLAGASAIDYDAHQDLLYVTAGGYASLPARLLAFPRTADGDVAPARSVCGPQLPGEPIGVAIVPSADEIFGGGFDFAGC
jgi:hypothetical protein